MYEKILEIIKRKISHIQLVDDSDPIIIIGEEYSAKEISEMFEAYHKWIYKGCPFMIGEGATGKVIAWDTKTDTQYNLDELFTYWFDNVKDNTINK